jgi:hypothetical protein
MSITLYVLTYGNQPNRVHVQGSNTLRLPVAMYHFLLCCSWSLAEQHGLHLIGRADWSKHIRPFWCVGLLELVTLWGREQSSLQGRVLHCIKQVGNFGQRDPGSYPRRQCVQLQYGETSWPFGVRVTEWPHFMLALDVSVPSWHMDPFAPLHQPHL